MLMVVDLSKFHKMVTKHIKDISVLVVDDNNINRQVIAFAMKKFGLSVDIAENGLIATRKYEQNPYDLVLMDIMMPVMDGRLATQAIRKMEQEKGLANAQIFAISANVQENDFQELYELGFNRISKKPLNLKILEKWLKEVYSFD
jgi:CheY-like chemotaxis protein